MRAVLVALTFVAATGVALADWKKDLKDAAKQQAGAKVEQSLGLANPAPAGSSVYFINLKTGATVASPVLVQFGLKGAGVSPPGVQSADTGHHVLLVDDPQFDATLALPLDNPKIIHFDKGQTETALTLTPGSHTLQLLFADWKQQAFNPSVQSEKITVTVSGAAPAKK
ncbi:MAG: DUF4399 domain-containing protein [Gammaproteobacteria bacterium]|uniref:DUF4399 domain-containing protein n=1 Tax=Nevskia sp. TaxID=1929292 RepID=UPI004036636D|nr:DUF4399 domain-containing protein [Gammaproteobacteria bacterium]